MLIFFVLIFKKKASKAKIKKRLTSSDKPPRLFSIIITNHNKLKSFNQKFRKFWYKPNMHIKKKAPSYQVRLCSSNLQKTFHSPIPRSPNKHTLLKIPYACHGSKFHFGISSCSLFLHKSTSLITNENLRSHLRQNQHTDI